MLKVSLILLAVMACGSVVKSGTPCECNGYEGLFCGHYLSTGLGDDTRIQKHLTGQDCQTHLVYYCPTNKRNAKIEEADNCNSRLNCVMKSLENGLGVDHCAGKQTKRRSCSCRKTSGTFCGTSERTGADYLEGTGCYANKLYTCVPEQGGWRKIQPKGCTKCITKQIKEEADKFGVSKTKTKRGVDECK